MLLLTSVCHAGDQKRPPQIQGAEYFWGTSSSGAKVMCVIQQPHKSGDGVSFTAWNSLPVPVSIIFNAELKNLKATVPFPHVLVVPGYSSLSVYQATRIDNSRPFTWSNNWTWKIGKAAAVHDNSFLYSLPFAAGKSFAVLQGYNGDFSHKGELAHSIDWDLPEGEPVQAARDGTVAFVQDSYHGNSTDPSWKDRTNTISIYHRDGTMAEYSHISQFSSRVKAGDNVSAGQTLALSGNVGYSSGPHLHFRVYRIIRQGNELKEESIPVFFKDAAHRKINPGR